MKLVFVYFDFMKGAGGKYYEGIASISAVLKQAGHLTQLFHITEHINCEDFLGICKERYAGFDIIAFSATTNAFNYVATYSKELKRHLPNATIVCGGIHPTLCPEEAIQQEGIDIICIGEGEYPMLELCSRLEANEDIGNIRNLWIKRDGNIVKNPARPLIEDLDSLPMPDREIFDFESSVDRRMKRMVFMGSRGCPFNCAHCCNHALKKLYPDRTPYVRFKSVSRIISEIEACLTEHKNIECIVFHDDILNLKPSWFAEFASRYKESIGVPYIGNSRFDLLNDDTIGLFERSGCYQLSVGLESGDDYIRNEVLKRNQNKTQILKLSDLHRKRGIRLSVYTMVGIPFENLSKALNTVKMTAKLRPDKIQTSIYYPYAQTELYDLCKEKGFLTDKNLDSYFEPDTILNLPGFPEKELRFAYRKFRIFVSYYMVASECPRVLGFMLEKTIDFMWHHPPIYLFLEPIYGRFKQFRKWVFRMVHRKR